MAFGPFGDLRLKLMNDPSIRITDLADPRLDPFRDLRGAGSAHPEFFVAEGPTVVKRLFASRYRTHSVLVTDAKWDDIRPVCPDNAQLIRIARPLAEELVGFRFHAGVLAAGYREPSPDLESLVVPKQDALILVAHEVIDRQNVGALIRVATAFSATALVCGPRCGDPFSRPALRVSMGNGFRLPICRTESTQEALQTLQSLGLQVIGTALGDSAIPLPQLSNSARQNRPRRLVVVFGNESNGLPENIIKQCDTRATIPMADGTDSLNVGLAAGIFLYELRRGDFLHVAHAE